MKRLTRAQFLKASAAAGAGAALLAGCGAGGGTGGASPAARSSTPARPQVRDPLLAVATGALVAANVERAVAAVGGMKAFVRRGDVVVVKPNICTARAPEYAATTNPEVVATLVRLARDAGAGQVLVMDNPLSEASAAYSVSGIEAAAEAAGGIVHLMCDDGYRDYAIPGTLLTQHPLYTAVAEADVVISAPVAKQHGSAGLTLAGKNLMGATNERGRMHRAGLSRSIAELAAALRPDLAVIDATRILVRNGPTGGNLDDVVAKDTIIVSADWVAADAYATGLFGMTPADVPYIGAAAGMKLGTMDLSSVRIRSV